MTQALQISAQRFEEAADAYQLRGQGDEAEQAVRRAKAQNDQIKAIAHAKAVRDAYDQNARRKMRRENKADPLLKCQLTDRQTRAAGIFRDAVATAGQLVGSTSNFDRVGGGLNDNVDRCVERAVHAKSGVDYAISRVSCEALRTAAFEVVLGKSFKRAIDRSPRAYNGLTLNALKESVRELLDGAIDYWSVRPTEFSTSEGENDVD